MLARLDACVHRMGSGKRLGSSGRYTQGGVTALQVGERDPEQRNTEVVERRALSPRFSLHGWSPATAHHKSVMPTA